MLPPEQRGNENLSIGNLASRIRDRFPLYRTVFLGVIPGEKINQEFIARWRDKYALRRAGYGLFAEIKSYAALPTTPNEDQFVNVLAYTVSLPNLVSLLGATTPDSTPKGEETEYLKAAKIISGALYRKVARAAEDRDKNTLKQAQLSLMLDKSYQYLVSAFEEKGPKTATIETNLAGAVLLATPDELETLPGYDPKILVFAAAHPVIYIETDKKMVERAARELKRRLDNGESDHRTIYNLLKQIPVSQDYFWFNFITATQTHFLERPQYQREMLQFLQEKITSEKETKGDFIGNEYYFYQAIEQILKHSQTLREMLTFSEAQALIKKAQRLIREKAMNPHQKASIISTVQAISSIYPHLQVNNG